MRIFFDTCIWLELCVAKSPETHHEIRQAEKAGNLLAKALKDNCKIVTCNEQLLEIFSAVVKYKMREYNRACKSNNMRGVGSLKDFRDTDAFPNVQALCKTVFQDVLHLAENKDLNKLDLYDLLDNIHLVDINDYIYYNYCIKSGIDFYTFDNDFSNLKSYGRIHII